MSKFALAIGFVATTLVLLLFSASFAHAQANRTWVKSGVLLEDPPCTRTQPCAHFSEAIAKTNAGGEISVINSGNYGPVTITKSISIVAEGPEGGITLASAAGSAITINAGANDVINLRGLVLDGAGTGGTGINFLAGRAVHVQNCVIKRFAGVGIRLESSFNSQLFVSDCVIAGIGGSDPGIGILVKPTGSATARVALNRVRVENNAIGIKADGAGGSGGVKAAVRDSVIAGHTSAGVQAAAPASGGPVQLMADGVSSVNNDAGILANGGGATIIISGSTVTGNTRGLRRANGGAIASFGNNSVTGNTINGTPSTTLALQ